jgi:hypothetical protein
VNNSREGFTLNDSREGKDEGAARGA